MEYGLIGQPLAHSFSKPLHERLGGYAYALCPVNAEEAAALLRARAFLGLNVTIPYKQFVLPFCDELDPGAKAIGAVNTIVNRNGRLIGYNTDLDGFRYLVQSINLSLAGKTVLILGGGATQKTAAYCAQNEGAARVLTASRRPGPTSISYEQARKENVHVLINTTPVGMYPMVDELPIDPTAFPRLEAVLDVVYNPLKTRLVLAAKALGLPAAGGLDMLVAQAKYAAELFLGKTLPEDSIPSITQEIFAKRANLVLIGMPGSGKTTLGRALSQCMGRPFVDIDAYIEQQAGKPIAAIFAEQGEAAFRALEEEAIARAAKETGQVISTGGGSILLSANIARLRQNGIILYVYRPLDALTLGEGRPLSQTREDIEALFKARAPLYEAAADHTIDNIRCVEATVQRAYEAFLEAACPNAHNTRTNERNPRS